MAVPARSVPAERTAASVSSPPMKRSARSPFGPSWAAAPASSSPKAAAEERSSTLTRWTPATRVRAAAAARPAKPPPTTTSPSACWAARERWPLACTKHGEIAFNTKGSSQQTHTASRVIPSVEGSGAGTGAFLPQLRTMTASVASDMATKRVRLRSAEMRAVKIRMRER
eukprot:scaffold35222_cov72-Phaeocystis_antarctica.AAC.2